MSRNNKDEEALLAKIRAKRKILADYLLKSEPRQSRLINFSIVAGALAAALTAGPGIGGESSCLHAIFERDPSCIDASRQENNLLLNLGTRHYLMDAELQ